MLDTGRSVKGSLALKCPVGEFAALHMSAFGTKRTFHDGVPMSAFGGKADIHRSCWDVPFVTKAQGPGGGGGGRGGRGGGGFGLEG